MERMLSRAALMHNISITPPFDTRSIETSAKKYKRGDNAPRSVRFFMASAYVLVVRAMMFVTISAGCASKYHWSERKK